MMVRGVERNENLLHLGVGQAVLAKISSAVFRDDFGTGGA